MHARGMEQHSHGVNNVPGVDQHRAGLRADRPAGVRLLDHHRPGQRPGRPRARPEGRPAPRRPGHREPRAPPATSPTSGASPRRSCRTPGSTATRCSARSSRGEIQGLLVLVVQPGRVAAGQHVRQADAGEAGVLRLHRLLPERDGPVRRRGPARLAARGGRGDRLLDRGAGHQDQPGGRRRPGDAKQDWRILQDIAQALGRERGFTFASPREIFEELRRRQPGRRRRLLGHHLREDRAADGRLLAVPGHRPRTATRSTTRARRGCSSRGRGTRSRRGPGRSTSRTARPASTRSAYEPPTEDVDADYPVILTTGRVVSMFLSGQPDAADRPAGGPVPGAAPGAAPDPRRASTAIADGDWVTVESRRGSLTVRCQVVTTIRPDMVFVPYHWAGAEERQPGDDRRPGPDLEDPRVQGAAPSASARPTRRRSTPAGSNRSNRPPGWSAHGPRPARLLHRPEPLHRLPGVRPRLLRVRHAQGALDDPPGVRRPRARRCRRCRWSACTATRRPAPRSARPTRSSGPATAWCRRPASRAASPATTACSPARSACRR